MKFSPSRVCIQEEQHSKQPIKRSSTNFIFQRLNRTRHASLIGRHKRIKVSCIVALTEAIERKTEENIAHNIYPLSSFGKIDGTH